MLRDKRELKSSGENLPLWNAITCWDQFIGCALYNMFNVSMFQWFNYVSCFNLWNVAPIYWQDVQIGKNRDRRDTLTFLDYGNLVITSFFIEEVTKLRSWIWIRKTFSFLSEIEFLGIQELPTVIAFFGDTFLNFTPTDTLSQKYPKPDIFPVLFLLQLSSVLYLP